MNKNSEFIDVEWYDAGLTGLPLQNIGIVLIYNKHAGFKAYMGIGFGNSKEDDIKRIYEMGTKIDHRLAKAVWGKRMQGEWLTRHLSAKDLSYYIYDGKAYKNA